MQPPMPNTRGDSIMSKELDTLWNTFINSTWQSVSVPSDTIISSQQAKDNK